MRNTSLPTICSSATQPTKIVKKTTSILLTGDCECQAYSNGTYGTKVKKAMEYNSKGCNIQIIKEADLIKN